MDLRATAGCPMIRSEQPAAAEQTVELSPRERSLQIQAAISQLRARREMLRKQIARLLEELHTLTPRRPHTGILAAVLEVLRDSHVPMTSRQIAERLPKFAYHRVQVMVHQAWRKGYAIKRPVEKSRAQGGVRWEFSLPSRKRKAAR
jgi:hypothetical protein